VKSRKVGAGLETGFDAIMEWMSDPVLGGLWSEPVPAKPMWDKVGDALELAGVRVLRMANFNLVLYRHGRMARFQHAAGRMWRYQARVLREFLEDADEPPRRGDGGGGGLRRGGWTASISFDALDRMLVGRLQATGDPVTFHADTVPFLVDAFGWAVDDYMLAAQRFGRRPPEPLGTGGLRLRIRPRVHHLVVQAAAARGMTLNAWMEDAALRMARSELRQI
jgi:predicted HicB family RNase H-like nuclease